VGRMFLQYGIVLLSTGLYILMTIGKFNCTSSTQIGLFTVPLCADGERLVYAACKKHKEKIK